MQPRPRFNQTRHHRPARRRQSLPQVPRSSRLSPLTSRLAHLHPPNPNRSLQADSSSPVVPLVQASSSCCCLRTSPSHESPPLELRLRIRPVVGVALACPARCTSTDTGQRYAPGSDRHPCEPRRNTIFCPSARLPVDHSRAAFHVLLKHKAKRSTPDPYISPNSRPPVMSPPTAASQSSRHNNPPSVASSSRRSADPRRDSFPFSFNRPSRANPSSTSLVPSIAEGKPIPLDDSTAEHRTSALREINNHYPSRYQYAKSSGAQSSTYSEPVIVRSYHPPAPGRRPVGTKGVGCVAHGRSTSTSVSEAGGPGHFFARGLPFYNKVGSAGSGMLGTMALARANNGTTVQVQQETRLPPVEAFSFKSFMANMEAQGGDDDINADLDRIAEICARSRYSLSNQYEVHYAPHGSGASFLAAAQQHQQVQGPTLQAVSSDDERSMKRQRRKPHAGRRNSRAMGTLETIMSSSRSSDEEKSKQKQKSAAEIADEVRGRASCKETETPSSATSSASAFQDASLQDEQTPCKTHVRRPSASLALIDGSRQSPLPPNVADQRPTTSGLVGEPALPQASTSHLETRTAPEQTPQVHGHNKSIPVLPSDCHNLPMAKGSIPSIQEPGPGAGLFTALGSWIPWVSTEKHGGRAEGSLRHLLKTANYNKGKGVAKVS